MKKNGKNEELQSRREFFKRAAKGALPILAGAALLSSPILSETANAMSCAGCNNRCMNSCFNTCHGTCSRTCSGTDQLVHAEDWLLFEKNIGAYICIDEVALSRGELYTVLTNKEAHGGKGSMIAIIKGTDVHTVTSVLLKLSRRRRYQVREITLDMAPNMEQIARICFPAAKRVTDRFHVQKLAYEAVQEMRVKARWEALDEESTQIAYAKACGKMYHAPVFANGDTRKQLLARSIYLLYKKESLWTQSQRIRAEILFKEYPDIKKGYYLSMRLGLIYHQCKFKDIALTRLARWYDEVDKSGFLTFGRVARSIQTHYLDIINFFERRATNAAAESFNAKIKAFRAQFRGVRDRAFFLYRLAKLYA